jgi:hypothetical protein
MNPLRYLRTYLHGLWCDFLDRLRPAPDPPDARPLPPRIPPEALAMAVRPEPALTRVKAEPPLRGSLADRMRRERSR